MPTALEQQAQFQQILRDSLAPIFEYTVASQRSQNHQDELRNRAQIASGGEAAALERANIAARAHIEGIREQSKQYLDRLDAKDKDAQLRKLRATIPQNPKEKDEDYFVRATAALPSILDNADSNIAALNARSLAISRRAETTNLARARTAAANSIRPFLDPAGANEVVSALSAGMTPEQVIAQASKTGSWYQLWSRQKLSPKEQNDILAGFQDAYAKALEKPQYPESLQTELRNTEDELKRAIASRELLRSSFPEATLGQAAKTVAALPSLDVKSLVSGAGNEMRPLPAPTVPRVAAPVVAGPPPEFQSPTYTRGLLPTIAGAVTPVKDFLSAGASLVPVARQNLGTMLTGGNYVNPFSSPEVDRYAQRGIGEALGNYLAQLGAPKAAPAPSLVSQFGRFANAIRNPFAAQQVPAELTSVPNPAPSPDEEALMRELQPFLFQQ